MPRVLGIVQNELRIEDKTSGSTIVLYYRTPDTKDRQGYMNEAVQRKRNKITMHQAEARLKYGLKILTGVRDGDFLRLVDGRQVAMSSNPGSPDYCAEWKKEVEAGAGDLVMLLAAHVFDAPAEVMDPEDDDDAEKNSGETLPA